MSLLSRCVPTPPCEATATCAPPAPADASDAGASTPPLVALPPDPLPGCDRTKSPADAPCLVSEVLGVFLAPSGDDAQAGTKAAPVHSFARALALAKASGRRRIYACSATYDDAVLVLGAGADGDLAVFGGLLCPPALFPSEAGSDAADLDASASDATAVDAATNDASTNLADAADPSDAAAVDAAPPALAWSAASGSRAVFAPAAAGRALTVSGYTGALRFEDLEFHAVDATPPGASSIAAFVSESAKADFVRVVFTAGDVRAAGAAALTPTAQLPSPTPGNEGNGTLGARVVCTCPGGGVSGGGAGEDNSAHALAESGLPALDGGAGGRLAGDCNNSVDGQRGANGAPAPPAKGATSSGALSAGGWTPATGVRGDYGAPGQGGGGGSCNEVVTDDPVHGGGGGCGGCGGAPAAAGESGGSSMGLIVFQTPVTLSSCQLTAGNAGAGGAGAPGQPGADGAAGSNPSLTPATQGGSFHFAAICGGANGGRGGDGAASGGGAGGNSIGVGWSGTAPVLDDGSATSIRLGAAGAGGGGGAGLATQVGVGGVAAGVHDL